MCLEVPVNLLPREQNKKTRMSLIERCDGLEWPKGEVPLHQHVMKTNLKTAGSDE